MANKELMEVLVGVRDLIMLDNDKKMRKDGEYLVIGTIFDVVDNSDNKGRKLQDNYPELNALLNEVQHLDKVNTAIEQLQLLQLLED